MENWFQDIEFFLDEKGDIQPKKNIKKDTIDILELYKYERQICLQEMQK